MSLQRGDMASGNNDLSDEVKASVIDSGALANLKGISHDAPRASNDDLDALKQQANNAIDNIQQLLDTGKLDDTTSQKLTAALAKLRSVVGKDGVSRSALAMALSEASTAVAGSDGNGKTQTLQQKTDQLWQQIEAANKEIDDDFEKMRKEGVTFNEKLWNRHKELMEYLEAHPRDIKAQKELDAVDDALLVQAEPQLNEHPDAKPAFTDARDKSKDRHELVDKKLANLGKRSEMIDSEISMSDFGDTQKLTMNDIATPAIGQKSHSSGRQQG